MRQCGMDANFFSRRAKRAFVSANQQSRACWGRTSAQTSVLVLPDWLTKSMLFKLDIYKGGKMRYPRTKFRLTLPRGEEGCMGNLALRR